MSAKKINNVAGSLSGSWHGRAAMTLTNGVLEATLLPGGGHLASCSFVMKQGPSQDNVLWKSPWKTADPGTHESAVIAAECGDEGAGRFLASYTGHALCLDGFGPASTAEAAAGVSLHGEASTATWTFTQLDRNSASGVAVLPVAQLRVERKFLMIPQESVLRVQESVTNLRTAERKLHWVQHATFGAPLFGAGVARATASVRDGITWPLDYEGCNLLLRDSPFIWPFAPGADGERVDLRELFVRNGSGFVAAAHQAADREYGFVAVCHAEIGMTVAYLFPTKYFPWLTVWEENRARRDLPWCGQVQARGLEFGTTPLPLGNETVDVRGPLLGRPTAQKIGVNETLQAPWLLFLAAVPRGWTEIDDVRVEADEIVLIHGSEQIRVNARGAAEFLDGTEQTKKVGMA